MTHFDVEKDTAAVRFKLEKANLPKIVAEVIAMVDLSGSTRELYYGGTMQEAIQRVVPVALNFDDNGELPVYGFNDGSEFCTLPVLTKTNYPGYVQREITDKPSVHKWGGTDYSPVIKQALRDLGFLSKQSTGIKSGKGIFNRLFGGSGEEQREVLMSKSTSGLPAIAYFFTDGGCSPSDEDPTETLMKSLANLGAPIYFNMIGVGHADFRFLKKIADDLPNVEFTAITNLAATAGSDAIYDHLIPEELLEWLKKYVVR